MYATAHRIKSPAGETAIHAFLHRHDRPDCPFPDDPWLVPGEAPGRLDRQHTVLPAGGNEVLSYLDLIIPEGLWESRWQVPLRLLADGLSSETLPFQGSIGPVRVIFSASPEQPGSQEYLALLDAVLALLTAP